MTPLPLTVALLAAVAASPPPEPAAAERVAAGVMASQSRLQRLLLDHYLRVRYDDGAPVSNRFVEAFDRDNRFLDAIHFAEPSSPPWLDVERKQVWSNRSGVTVYRVFERKAVASLPVPDFLHDSRYTTSIGWRTMESKETRLVDGRPFFLIDLLGPNRQAGVKVLPEQVTVDGLTCDVIEADGGRDRVWVCPSRGYSIVKRVFGRTGESTATLDLRCAEFTEVAPGMWLPKLCSGEYTYVKPARKVAFEIRVNHLAVNEGVPDSQFRPRFAPGTVVFDEHKALITALPGGQDLFDLWIAVLKVNFPPSADPSSAPIPAEDYAMTLTGFALAVCGIGLVKATGRRSAALVPAGAGGRPNRDSAAEAQPVT